MRACRAFAWVAALLAAAAPLPTQQEPPAKRDRRPMVGTVVGSDERAIAGACVVVAHVPAGEDSLPARHHATATTDARGRFHVDVLAGVDYRVFAIGPPDEHGTRLVSEVQLTTANTLLTLRATERMPVRTFRLEHAERWREFAPLRLRVLPAGAELPGYELPLGDDGRATLPPLPSGYSSFEVLTDGGVLATATHASAGDLTMVATPVRDVPIELTDEEGRPVAGAQVQQRHTSPGWTGPRLSHSDPFRQTHRNLGQSDADGRVLARVACADDPLSTHPGRGLLLSAAAPGHRAAAAGTIDRLFEGTTVRGPAGGPAAVQIRLARAAAPRIRLRFGDAPLAGCQLLATGQLQIKKGRELVEIPFQGCASTDEDGWATFLDLPTGLSAATLKITQPLPPDVLAALPVDTPARALVLPYLPVSNGQELDLDVATFRRARVRVLDPDAAPARTARLVIAQPQGEKTELALAAEFPLDASGQLAALLPPGPWWMFAAAAEGHAFSILKAGGADPTVLRLLRPLRVHGRMLDPRGQGVAGASARLVAIQAKAGDVEPLLHRLLVQLWWNQGPIRTGADGAFEFRVPNLPEGTPWIEFENGGRRSPQFAAVGTEPIELVIPNR